MSQDNNEKGQSNNSNFYIILAIYRQTQGIDILQKKC